MPGQQCSIPRSTERDWYYLPTFGYIHIGQWVDRNIPYIEHFKKTFGFVEVYTGFAIIPTSPTDLLPVNL